MENKKTGGVLIVLTVIIAILIWGLSAQLEQKSAAAFCNPSPECRSIEKSMSFVHVSIGVLSFMLALGIYLFFFYKGSEEVLRRLAEEKERQVHEERLDIMLMMLDSLEQRIFKAILEQDGIEQNTLTLRTNLSRSKISEVLKSFEAKNLIKRKKKGKTFQIFISKKI